MQSRIQSDLSRPDRRLPRRQLVARAKAGSAAHIRELYETFKLEDCTLDLLKSTLDHLRPEFIPNIDLEDRLAAEALPHASTAAASLLLLSKLADASRTRSTHTESAVDFILPAMEGVLKWVNFCLDFGVPQIGEYGEKVAYILLSKLLFMLALLHQRLRQAFLDSRSFLRTFFRIWTAKDDSHGRHGVYWDFRPKGLDDDPIVGIAWVLPLGIDPLNATLALQEELSTSAIMLPFASATTQRMTQVRNAVADPEFPDGLVTYAIRLMHFVMTLLRVGVEDDNLRLNALLQCFSEVNSIGCVTGRLDRLTFAVIARQTAQGNQDPPRLILELLREPVVELLGHMFFKDQRQSAGMELYDHESRAFHVRVVEDLCEERYMALFQRRVGRWGLAIHDFHPIFECNIPKVNEEIVLFRTHPTPDLWMRKPDAPLVEKYLWPRMNSLGEIYNQRMKNSEMRLAEAIFTHGPKTDIYVYVLMKQVGQKSQGVYSISHIAASRKQT